MAGSLVGAEVFFFTDNAVAEAAFYSGTASSRTLFELVVELRSLELVGNFRLHLIHIAGTRMIAQGTDALSRGERHLGQLLSPLENIVPLHLTAIQRSSLLLPWIKSWAGDTIIVASPEDWFSRAHTETDHTWVWDLPPAAALQT